MYYDFTGKDQDLAYRFLASAVTPRPIAWVGIAKLFSPGVLQSV